MRKLITLLVAVLLTATVWAQSPQKMSYQAVIRNSSDVLVTSTQIGMEINIRQGSPTGTVVYTETQTLTTNANGLVSIEIGGAGFSSINWASDEYYIETKTAIVPPLTIYTITGTSQLLSVPYALHAKTAESISGGITETDPVFSVSPANSITSGNITNWTTAYGWGNHAGLYRPISYVPAWIEITNNPFLFTTPATDQLLKFNGTNWVNSTLDFALTTHTHANVTDTTNGFMSDADKTKLDELVNLTSGTGININDSNQVVNTAPDQTVVMTGQNGITVAGTYPNFTVSNSAKQATFRWNVFSTYDQWVGWMCGDNSSLFCGVNPSSWTNYNAKAAGISSDKEILRTFFINKAYAGKNAMVYSDTWYSYSSDNGKVVIALFRLKNNTGSNISWSPYFYYTANSGWGEYASAALNGTDVWNSPTYGNASLILTIPANRVSTFIIVSTSNLAVGTRTCVLAFYNNCLQLPTGLEFVDDLDSATGGWEQ